MNASELLGTERGRTTDRGERLPSRHLFRYRVTYAARTAMFEGEITVHAVDIFDALNTAAAQLPEYTWIQAVVQEDQLDKLALKQFERNMQAALGKKN